MAAGADRPWVRSVFWLGLGLATGVLLHAFWTRERVAPRKEVEPAPVVEEVRPAEGGAVAASVVSGFEAARDRILAGGTIEMSEILPRIEQFTAAECAELLELCSKLPEYERWVLSRAAAKRWAALEPEGVFAALPEWRGTENWSVLLQAASSELARRDPESLVAKFETAEVRDRYFMWRVMLEELARANPWRAAELASVNREFIRDYDLYQIVARHLGKESPEQALAWANGLWQPYARLAATHEIWKSWAAENPAGAAAEFARNRPSPAQGQELLRRIAASWSRKDYRAAAEWIETLAPQDRAEAWSGFEPDVKEANASELLGLVRSIESEKARSRLASKIATQLAMEDHAQALEWTKGLEADDQLKALPGVVLVWAQEDARAAGEYVLSVPAGETREQMIRNVLGQWAPLEPEAALAWVGQLPAGRERDVAVERAAGELHHFTPEITMRWLALVEDSEKRVDVTREMVSRWAQTDGAAAARWVGSSSDAQEHPEVYHAVARQWAFVDPAATAKWMAALPEGAIRDSAIDAYVSSVDGYDPSLATEWAANIQDGEMRARAVGSAFRRWVQKDSGAARGWLEQTPLPQEVRAALSSVLDQPHGH